MTDILDNFALTDGERSHPFWMRLKAHLESELQSRRVRNDRVDAPEQETAALRGEIRVLKALIRLGDDPPQTG